MTVIVPQRACGPQGTASHDLQIKWISAVLTFSRLIFCLSTEQLHYGQAGMLASSMLLPGESHLKVRGGFRSRWHSGPSHNCKSMPFETIPSNQHCILISHKRRVMIKMESKQPWKSAGVLLPGGQQDQTKYWKLFFTCVTHKLQIIKNERIHISPLLPFVQVLWFILSRKKTSLVNFTSCL